MAPKNKSTWILEKKDSSFEEFNALAAVLFPKRQGDDKLLLNSDFSFAVLSRYIRSMPVKKADGSSTRKFVVWFRMYLQTKQNTTQGNTSTDRRFTLAELEARLNVDNLTEWVEPFPFKAIEPDPYSIVHGVYGGADKTFCVGTLRTKGQTKNPPKKNEVIEIDPEDLPAGFDEASYTGTTTPYKKTSATSSSPRQKKTKVKLEKTDKASTNIMKELPPIKSKRLAAQRATSKIVSQKKKDMKNDLAEEKSEIYIETSESTTSESSSDDDGSKDSSSTKSDDTSSSSSSSSSDSSDSSDSDAQKHSKKRKRKRSKDKRSKKTKKEKKTKKSKEHGKNRTPKKDDRSIKPDAVEMIGVDDYFVNSNTKELLKTSANSVDEKKQNNETPPDTIRNTVKTDSSDHEEAVPKLTLQGNP